MVQFYSPSALPLEDTGAHLNVRLTLRPTIPHPDLTYLTDSAHGPESGVRLELGRDGGRPVDILDIDGTVSPKHAEILEQAIWQHMPEEHPLRADQFGNYQDQNTTQHSDPLALTQLLLTYHLLRQYSGVARLPFATPTAALSRVRAPQD